MVAPVVNLNTAGAFGLVNLTLADSTTGWSGFNEGGGGTPSPVLENDVSVHNGAAVSAKVSGSNQNEGVWYDNTTGIDMTVVGRHLYLWVAVTTLGLLNTIANGGCYVKIASDAAGNNWNKYFVGGSDFFPETSYGTPFARVVIDLNKTPSETAATAATLTSIRWFGAGIKSNGSSKSENLIVDRIDYGDGLQVEAGDVTDPATWQAIFDIDSALANRYGIVDKRGNTFFLKGGVTIGDPAGTVTTLWEDTSGANVEFELPRYHNGSILASGVTAADLYKIEVVGNATGTTDVTFGQVIGTGDDRQGLFGGSIGSVGEKWTFDAETDIADLDSVNLYGVTWSRAGITQFSGSTKTDIIGSTFVNCDEVQPNDAIFLNNRVVAPQPDRGLEIVSGHNIKRCTLIAGPETQSFERVWHVDVSPVPDTVVDETDDANSPATGDWDFFPAGAAIGDGCIISSRQKFSQITFDVGTARVGGSLSLTYRTASNWVSFAGAETDNTNGLSVTGVNTVSWDPQDIPNWVAASDYDDEPLWSVRWAVLSAMTTQPVGDEGSITELVEHATHIPAALNPVTFDQITYIGFGATGAPKWHGENSGASATTVINAINGSNPNENEFENTGSPAGTVTVNNTVTVRVTVIDQQTKAAIQGARVLLKAGVTGTLPFEDSVTITRSGSTATVTHTAHGLSTGQEVVIDGADQPEYNGLKSITVTGVNAYTYTVTGTPTTPATGTIVSTAVILSGLTNASGILEDTGFNFVSNQDASGDVKKGTAQPVYVPAPVDEVITVNGLGVTVQMVPDGG